MSTIIVTGSDGLVGSSCVSFFCEKGFDVIGIDNDMRGKFFGKEASTIKMRKFLMEKYKKQYRHFVVDIRHFDKIKNIIGLARDATALIHCAAQPSHDWAAKDPIIDFSINATATVLLLECWRKFHNDKPFIFMSTNKVYGDLPNYLPIVEQETRFEAYKNLRTQNEFSYFEVDERMSIDQSKHSVFGASKVAADVMVQEYGKYFDMPTVCFRGGCLTGPNHQGTKMHGFLSYLVKCIVHDKPYTIYGYGGKQVRDNIHSEDLVKMFWEFIQSPKSGGQVYNAGGGRGNDVSILEAISKIRELCGKDLIVSDNISFDNNPRSGDHKWYISDIRKFKKDFPKWNITKNIDDILKEMVNFELENEKV